MIVRQNSNTEATNTAMVFASLENSTNRVLKTIFINSNKKFLRRRDSLFRFHFASLMKSWVFIEGRLQDYCLKGIWKGKLSNSLLPFPHWRIQQQPSSTESLHSKLISHLNLRYFAATHTNNLPLFRDLVLTREILSMNKNQFVSDLFPVQPFCFLIKNKQCSAHPFKTPSP